ncbi:MAG: amidohydrolase [Syntrophaceae bacterium]|nr:amidohydrolase [Syntrophaceae bacterium]
MKKIDFEAHFWTEKYLKTLSENKGYPRFVEDAQNHSRRLWYNEEVVQPFGDPLLESLLDHGKGRLKRMDASGVDIQILSLAAPGIEQLDPAVGSALAVETNNALSEVIHRYPDRFMGFAALAPKRPGEAADELERCVKDLGFVGWNTHAHYGDSYLDEKQYRPILERAERLNVPIYLHPTVSAYSQADRYGFPLAGPPFGFGFEVLLCLFRMIYAGIFDEFPRLMVILGHLGEGLPFFMERVDWAYLRPFDPNLRPKISKKPSEYLRSNIFVATSGNHYEPAFRCTYEAMGIDRILLGTDYPFEEMDPCMRFLQRINLSQREKEKIYYLNAKRIGIAPAT